jgi:hypothetical protein
MFRCLAGLGGERKFFHRLIFTAKRLRLIAQGCVATLGQFHKNSLTPTELRQFPVGAVRQIQFGVALKNSQNPFLKRWRNRFAVNFMWVIDSQGSYATLGYEAKPLCGKEQLQVELALSDASNTTCAEPGTTVVF